MDVRERELDDLFYKYGRIRDIEIKNRGRPLLLLSNLMTQETQKTRKEDVMVSDLRRSVFALKSPKAVAATTAVTTAVGIAATTVVMTAVGIAATTDENVVASA